MRDLLLGGDPKDLDVLVEGDALAAADRMAAAAGRRGRGDRALRHRDGARPGGRLRSGACADARPTRGPGALPEVAPATLEEDLPRRDFTVNALAAALAAAASGRAARAARGARRPARAASFASSIPRASATIRRACSGSHASRHGLRFAPDAGTAALAREAIGAGALQTVSGPRLGAELRLLARDPAALRGGAVGPGERRAGLAAPVAAPSTRALTARALALLPSPLVLLASLARGFERGELRSRGSTGSASRRATATRSPPPRSTRLALAAELGAARRPSEIALRRVTVPTRRSPLARRARALTRLAAGRGRCTPAVPPPARSARRGPPGGGWRSFATCGWRSAAADLVAAGVSEGPGDRARAAAPLCGPSSTGRRTGARRSCGRR
ncbi:MAG: hypothetical protein WKF40_06010 [Thermoleophilaceae bacterium]